MNEYYDRYYIAGEGPPQSELVHSMRELCESLDTRALLTQYEILYRKHPDMTCDEAEKPNNVAKNRYRDISPCKFVHH